MTVAQLIERLRALPQELPACIVDGQMGGLVAGAPRLGEAYVSGKLTQVVLIGDAVQEVSSELSTLVYGSIQCLTTLM